MSSHASPAPIHPNMAPNLGPTIMGPFGLLTIYGMINTMSYWDIIWLGEWIIPYIVRFMETRDYPTFDQMNELDRFFTSYYNREPISMSDLSSFSSSSSSLSTSPSWPSPSSLSLSPYSSQLSTLSLSPSSGKATRSSRARHPALPYSKPNIGLFSDPLTSDLCGDYLSMSPPLTPTSTTTSPASHTLSPELFVPLTPSFPSAAFPSSSSTEISSVKPNQLPKNTTPQMAAIRCGMVECHDLGLEFTGLEAYKRHLSGFHGVSAHKNVDNARKQKCGWKDCGKEYGRHCLMMHIITHTKVKLVCKECNRSFCRKDVLSGHMRTIHPAQYEATGVSWYEKFVS